MISTLVKAAFLDSRTLHFQARVIVFFQSPMFVFIGFKMRSNSIVPLIMSNSSQSEQLRNIDDEQAHNEQLLALSSSVKMMADSLTEVAAVASSYFEETVNDVLNVLHHPRFCLEKLKLKITSLKVCQEVTVWVVKACTKCSLPLERLGST